MSNFSTRLKELRTAAGMSQKAFANRVGLSQTSISYYETDEVVPDIDFLAFVARWFNVSADWLLGLSWSRTSAPANKGKHKARSGRLTRKQYSDLQRCIGVLEGVGYALEDRAGLLYYDTLEELISIIAKLQPEIEGSEE